MYTILLLAVNIVQVEHLFSISYIQLPLALAPLVGSRRNTYFPEEAGLYAAALFLEYNNKSGEWFLTRCCFLFFSNSCRPCIAPKSAPAANADMVWTPR